MRATAPTATLDRCRPHPSSCTCPSKLSTRPSLRTPFTRKNGRSRSLGRTTAESREWHQFAEAADGWSAAAAAWDDTNDERKKTTLRRLARLETDLPSPPPLPLPVVPLPLEERCVVCGTQERTNAFVPCGHKAACEACAAQLLDTTRRCPVPGCAAHCLMSLRVSFAVTPPTTSRTPCNSPELQ